MLYLAWTMFMGLSEFGERTMNILEAIHLSVEK